MDQEENEVGPIGSDDPIPPHAMPAEQWERLKSEMNVQQK